MNTAPWMVVGDFNDPPETSSLSSFFASQGAKLLGDGKEPTRWDGTRCIDWAMSSGARDVSLLAPLGLCMGDCLSGSGMDQQI